MTCFGTCQIPRGHCGMLKLREFIEEIKSWNNGKFMSRRFILFFGSVKEIGSLNNITKLKEPW